MNYLKKCFAILFITSLTISTTQPLNITIPEKVLTCKAIAALATFMVGAGCSLYHANRHLDPDDDQHWLGFLGYYASAIVAACILSSDFKQVPQLPIKA